MHDDETKTRSRGEASLTKDFEAHRAHLRAVAYRMLGSFAEADEAVQDAWIRASEAGAADIENVRAWLTTIVGRVCLNALRARKARPEDAVGVHIPDPEIRREDAVDAEHETILAGSVGLALLIVLDALDPAERLAFVLHDMFDVPFEEIASLLARTPEATRQLASRARRRVQEADAEAAPDMTVARQRAVVGAFFTAARGGNFDALVSLLHPDIVLHSEGGAPGARANAVVAGADAVAKRAIQFAIAKATLHPVLVNGTAGVVITAGTRPTQVMSFTVVGGLVTRIQVIADPQRVAELAREALAADSSG